MLWMKSWIETRLRFLMAVGVFLLMASSVYAQFRNLHTDSSPVPADQHLEGTLSVFSLFFAMQAITLGGAGIKTQAPFQMAKGLHGSIHFTLSLPVSRFRILATRASIGALELLAAILVGTIGLGVLFPGINVSIPDILRYAFTLFACLLHFYAISTLLSTFLDDLWQVWGGLVIAVGLSQITQMLPLPEIADFYRTIENLSPITTHAIPWGAVAISLVMTAALLLAAAKIVQSRDY